MLWKGEVLPTSVAPHAPIDLVRQLEFRSATSYVWVTTWTFPTSHSRPRRSHRKETLPLPRTRSTQPTWKYRFTRTSQLGGIRRLLQAKAFLDRHESPNPFVPIIAWNAWTEGAALLPGPFHRLGFLEAIKDVFGSSDCKPKKEDIGYALS